VDLSSDDQHSEIKAGGRNRQEWTAAAISIQTFYLCLPSVPMILSPLIPLGSKLTMVIAVPRLLYLVQG
jgi:hypothetical protein